ncbi:hypothetical protein ACHAWF_011933 [Thalassiosira exigua]
MTAASSSDGGAKSAPAPTAAEEDRAGTSPAEEEPAAAKAKPRRVASAAAEAEGGASKEDAATAKKETGTPAKDPEAEAGREESEADSSARSLPMKKRKKLGGGDPAAGEAGNGSTEGERGEKRGKRKRGDEGRGEGNEVGGKVEDGGATKKKKHRKKREKKAKNDVKVKEEERTDLDDGDDDDRGSAAVSPRINDVLICDGPSSASSSSSTSNGAAAASKSSSPCSRSSPPPPTPSASSGSAFHHIGNRRFRVLVEANLSNYFSDDDEDDGGNEGEGGEEGQTSEKNGEGNDGEEGESDRLVRISRRERVAEAVIRSVEGNVPSGRFLVRRRREGALGEDERKQSKEGDDNDDNVDEDDEDDAQCEWRIASPPEVRAKVHATFRAARRFHLRAWAAEREAEREAAATEARMRREWESAAAAREAAKEARDRAAEAWARERLAESAARREAAVAGYAAGPPPPGRISAYGYPGAPLDQVAAVTQLWSYDHQRAILAAAAHLRAQERAGERIQSQLQGQSHARNLRQERTRRERIPRGHLGPIRTPHAHDVLLGRGKHANHPGNVRFRKAVEKLRPRYKSVKSAPIKYGDKKQYAKCVVDEVRGLYPPGRFLKEIPKTGLWIEIGDEQAFKKASQALREGRTAAEPGAPPVPSGPVPDPPLDQMAVAAVAQIQTQARQLLMYNEQLAILAAAEQLRAQEQDNRTWQEQVQRKELKRVVAAAAELQKKKDNQHSKKRERDESDDDNESLDTPPEAQGAGRRLTQAPFSSATVPPLWQGFPTRLPVGIPRPDPPELRFATTTLDADGGDSDSDASLELAEAGAEEAGDMVWQCNVCSTAEFDSYDSGRK